MSSQISPTNGKDAPNTSALPLFYHKPEPLDAKKHAGLSLKKNFGFSFSAKANAVPINLVEMPQICQHYPIAFSPDDHATPVAILGLQDSENLFVDAKGQWEPNTYIPAYIRRYPFIFSEMPDSDRLSLCVDINDSVIETSDAQPFFTPDGQGSELSQNALNFCKSYHAAAQQNVAFSQALVKNNLLIEREAQINTADGKRISFSGFKIIGPENLEKLSDSVFLEFRKNDWIGRVYDHFHSGGQWANLSMLLSKRMKKNAA